MPRQLILLLSFILIFSSKSFAQAKVLSDNSSSAELQESAHNNDHEHNHNHNHNESEKTGTEVTNKVVFYKTYEDNLDTLRYDVDTALHQTHNYNQMYKDNMSTINLGNYGSPYISNLYFDRPEVDFIFSDVYHSFYKNGTNLPIINTRTPYTELNYSNGGPKYNNEESIDGLFSANIGKNFNLGGYFDIIYARGRYAEQAARNKNFGLFSSYMGERYSYFFNIGVSKMENYENGGFGNKDAWVDSLLTNPVEGFAKQPENIPVRFQDEKARSFARNRFVSLNHKYNIGVMREVESGDSLKTEFIPAMNIIHQFEMESDVKQYNDKIGMSYYYDTAYIHSSLTTDSVRRRNISNRVGVYLDERINRFGKFGVGAYVQMNNIYDSQEPWSHIEDTTLAKGYTELMADYGGKNITTDSTRLDFINSYGGNKYTNLTLGGSIFKRYGAHFFFDASGKLCFTGYNIGDWQMKGNLRQVFPKMRNWEVSARANFQRKTPDYFLQHYYSNNFWWDNNFNPIYNQNLGGTLKIPSINLSLSVDFDNMQNYVFFNEKALPEQYSNNMAVMAVRLKKDFELGKHVVWENDVAFQQSSAPEVLPLPMITAYTNFYLRHILFKVLHFEIGAECRYHTSYKAPGYMPATGRFYNQDEVEIGNYPMINVYADFFLRRMRFFVMGQHINKGWPQAKNYFSAPHYAFNPRQFKMGLQWTFYD